MKPILKQLPKQRFMRIELLTELLLTVTSYKDKDHYFVCMFQVKSQTLSMNFVQKVTNAYLKLSQISRRKPLTIFAKKLQKRHCDMMKKEQV